MKEDQMLFCLIAFVLGFLINHMTRGSGLMVGGKDRVRQAQNQERLDIIKYPNNNRLYKADQERVKHEEQTNKLRERNKDIQERGNVLRRDENELRKDKKKLNRKNRIIENQMGRLGEKNKSIDYLRKENKELRKKLSDHTRELNKQKRIENCMKGKDTGSIDQLCSSYDMCEKSHR